MRRNINDTERGFLLQADIVGGVFGQERSVLVQPNFGGLGSYFALLLVPNENEGFRVDVNPLEQFVVAELRVLVLNLLQLLGAILLVVVFEQDKSWELRNFVLLDQLLLVLLYHTKLESFLHRLAFGFDLHQNRCSGLCKPWGPTCSQ